MKYVFTALIAIGALMFLAAPATADWDPGDGHKMHFPQMPDPTGWDVNFTGLRLLADDWLCTQTGPVSDIHFWFSSPQDKQFQLDQVRVRIHDNIPETPTRHSMPGDVLWERAFFPGTGSSLPPRLWGDGDQGWYDPTAITNPGVIPNDHNQIWQANIVDIERPFVQKQGNIYWLELSVLAMGPFGSPTELGWKTSLDHFEDDAVYQLPGSTFWNELRDPINNQSLDLAFVITPEPGTMAMLIGAGLMGLVACARRRRKA